MYVEKAGATGEPVWPMHTGACCLLGCVHGSWARGCDICLATESAGGRRKCNGKMTKLTRENDKIFKIPILKTVKALVVSTRQFLLTTKTEGPEGTRTRLPVLSGVGSSQHRRPHRSREQALSCLAGPATQPFNWITHHTRNCGRVGPCTKTVIPGEGSVLFRVRSQGRHFWLKSNNGKGSPTPSWSVVLCLPLPQSDAALHGRPGC